MKYFKSKFLKNIVAGLLLAHGAFLFAGCNTVEGAGEDVEAVGEGVSDAADGD